MRTKSLALPLVREVALVALLTGCGADHRTEVKRCVDDQQRVVPDEQCEWTDGRSPSSSAWGSHGGRFWYYGGRGYAPGDIATGGSRTPTPGLTSVRPSAPGHLGGPSARGGFGASGEAASGAS